jgi:hypothetical protein
MAGVGRLAARQFESTDSSAAGDGRAAIRLLRVGSGTRTAHSSKMNPE